MQLSDVLSADQSFRIDSEYFKKDDIKRLLRIEELSHASLKTLTHKIDVGYVGAMTTEYTDDTAAPKLLQTRNIDEFIPNDTDLVHINLHFHDELKKSQIRTNDILIARSGSFGNAAIWLDKETVNSSDIIIIEADSAQVEPCYLVAFLNSRYGRFQLERYASGAVQEHVNLTILENLKIAFLSDRVQNRISSAVHDAYNMLMQSRKVYCDAESALLKELGFANWRPTDGGVSTKSLSGTIAVGRIDAEYFQPKFYEIEARIRTRATGVLCAADAQITGLCKSDDDKVEQYIELADIGASGTVESCTKAEFADLPSRARQRVSKGQVIVSSIEGSLKSCALITSDFDGALCSTGFHRFQTDKINPETLLLLFKSWPIQELLKRGCSGTILSGISADSLENIPLPILPQCVQSFLADKVRESFRLRNKSKRILDLAKFAVELAIEKGEDTALSYMMHKGA